MGDAGAVGELAALCVKENQNMLHQDYTEVETYTTELKHVRNHAETDKFYRVSYFNTPFNKKGI